MSGKFFNASMLRFVLVGIANTLLSVVIMFLLEGLGYWPSTAIAFIVSSVMSFFLNRSFTFHSSEPLLSSAVKFSINIAVCYLLAYSIAPALTNWFLPYFLKDPVWMERVTKIFAMVLFTMINYVGQRYFAFSSRKA